MHLIAFILIFAILSRVTRHGVWIDNWIYLALITRRYKLLEQSRQVRYSINHYNYSTQSLGNLSSLVVARTTATNSGYSLRLNTNFYNLTNSTFQIIQQQYVTGAI
jgi:hypothetical protein